MSVAEQLLATLRESREPMSNRELREALGLEGTQAINNISQALNYLRSKGLVVAEDREEGGRGYRIATAADQREAEAEAGRIPATPQRTPRAKTVKPAKAKKPAKADKPKHKAKPKPEPKARKPRPAKAAPPPAAAPIKPKRTYTRRQPSAAAAIANAPNADALRKQLRLLVADQLIAAGAEPMPADTTQRLAELIRLAA